MTTITISTIGDNRRVEVSGHSGYAETGKDIVCAGISALTQAYALECAERTQMISLRVSPGLLDVTVKINEAESILLGMMIKGLEGIQNIYSEYMEIKYIK